jgi:hypothetical protein
VKPENVLVDAQGRLRLTDFGLAAAGDLERLTRSGVVMGTPFYMSPEQLTGSRAEVGPQSDVWALGVMLYQALTDRLPFSAHSLAALAVEVVTGAFAPPRRLRADVPADLETVCLQALQPEPADRYPDAEALAQDLERVLRGERPLARRRRRVPWAALGLVPALLLPASAWALLALRPAPAPPAQAPPRPSRPAEPPLPPPTAGEELDALAAGGDPWARAEAAARWLLANPQHPRALEARELEATGRGEVPLHVFRWETEKPLSREGAFVDGARFVSWTSEEVLRPGDFDARRLLPPWPGEHGTTALQHPAGGFLLGVGAGVRWLVPEGDGLRLRQQLRCASFPAALALAPRRGLVAAAVGHMVEVHRLADGARVAALPLGLEATCVRFSPDEQLLVGGGVEPSGDELAAGWLQAWRVEDFAPAWRVEALEGFYCLAFTPDGRQLLAGARSCLLLLVDPASGEARALQGEVVGRGRLGAIAHNRPVKGLAITPDGRRLVSVASAMEKADSELAVWDLPAGTLARPVIRIPAWRACSLAMDASGRRLLIGTEDQALLAWLTPP